MWPEAVSEGYKAISASCISVAAQPAPISEPLQAIPAGRKPLAARPGKGLAELQSSLADLAATLPILRGRLPLSRRHSTKERWAIFFELTAHDVVVIGN